MLTVSDSPEPLALLGTVRACSLPNQIVPNLSHEIRLDRLDVIVAHNFVHLNDSDVRSYADVVVGMDLSYLLISTIRIT